MNSTLMLALLPLAILTSQLAIAADTPNTAPIAPIASSTPKASASTDVTTNPLQAPEKNKTTEEKCQKPTYEPDFLPKELIFKEEELNLIRDAASKRVAAFHLAMTSENETHGKIQVANAESNAAISEYSKWAMKHTKEVFERHALYTQIIFWMVILIVTSGIVLTWYQFFQDSSAMTRVVRQLLNKIARGDQTKVTETNALQSLIEILRAEQSVEFGKDGIKMKTRVLGLITLLFSMGFFYLYLDTVYQVDVKETISRSEKESTSSK